MRKSSKKLFISQKDLKPEFVKVHMNWNMAFWENILFTYWACKFNFLSF